MRTFKNRKTGKFFPTFEEIYKKIIDWTFFSQRSGKVFRFSGFQVFQFLIILLIMFYITTFVKFLNLHCYQFLNLN